MTDIKIVVQVIELISLMLHIWFTEEIGTYMRCWESPGDLPLVIEIVVSFRSFRSAPLAKRHNISITRGRSPGLSQERM
jgi:hypothetical protein